MTYTMKEIRFLVRKLLSFDDDIAWMLGEAATDDDWPFTLQEDPMGMLKEFASEEDKEEKRRRLMEDTNRSIRAIQTMINAEEYDSEMMLASIQRIIDEKSED